MTTVVKTLVGKVLDMSQTCCKVGQMLENFKTNMADYDTSYWRFLICRAYQMMTWRKKWHFLFFIAFLNSLWREDYITRKKKKKACSEVRFFALKFGTFWAFPTCLDMLCAGVGAAKFEMSWHTTIPTKSFVNGYLPIFQRWLWFHLFQDGLQDLQNLWLMMHCHFWLDSVTFRCCGWLCWTWCWIKLMAAGLSLLSQVMILCCGQNDHGSHLAEQLTYLKLLLA